MAIIIDLKNAVRKAIFTKDERLTFFFNEILRVEYPYVFFYIPSFKLERAIDSEYWRKLTLMCVIEYAEYEDNPASVLWEYADTLAEVYKLFDFADTKLRADDIEFKIVNDVLQMTFNLEFYVKKEDETELMEYLDLTIRQE
ncbi:MAG: hypothetical protein NC191_04510 [Muribaculaceae bacterium]|nr:hypothetical protein [Muribaculaceae bacterium]